MGISDVRSVFKLGAVLQSEQRWLIDEWVKEQQRQLSRPGRTISAAELSFECTVFLAALRNTLAHAPQLVFADPSWSEVRHLLKVISSSRVDQGFSTSEAAGFVLSLQHPLLHAVRKTYGSEPLSTVTELMGAAAELIDDLARNLLDLYQQNRDSVIQQQRSELLALYEKAQQAVRSRDEVLAIVCHDLRNQLMQVVTARSLYDRTPETDMKEHLHGMMKRQTQSMVRLLGDLLDSTALDHGQLTINKDWIDPEYVLNETLELQVPVAERKQIRVLKEIAVGIPGIQCDSMRIGQVLSNLLSNAIKFTSEGGTITVRLDRKDNHVRFSVSDTGPGISEEDQPHVFERYWRGKTDNGGVGLGLTIVNAIVKAHGGNAWVESEVGKGSTFSFSLPESTVQSCAA